MFQMALRLQRLACIRAILPRSRSHLCAQISHYRLSTLLPNARIPRIYTSATPASFSTKNADDSLTAKVDDLERQYGNTTFMGFYEIGNSNLKNHSTLCELKTNCMKCMGFGTIPVLMAFGFDWIDFYAVQLFFASFILSAAWSSAFSLLNGNTPIRICLSRDEKVVRITYLDFWGFNSAYYRVDQFLPLSEQKNQKDPITIRLKNDSTKYIMFLENARISDPKFRYVFGESFQDIVFSKKA